MNPFESLKTGSRSLSLAVSVLFLTGWVAVSLAQNTCYTVDSLVHWVDGNTAPFHQVKAGDTLCLMAGLRGPLLLENLTGTADKPIVITNRGGVVTINTDSYYGISIRNSRHFRLTGTGDPDSFYGIHIARVASGAGLGIGSKSSDMEIDHLSIQNTSIGGIYAKTDPDIEGGSTRDQFTQRNTRIHDNYLDSIGNEGLYIGSTKYWGETVNYQGRDTLVFAPLLEGVRIYNNILRHTGWDGIQVSSASSDCQIFDNTILWDSQAEYYSQMSGIIIGGGTKCDCYNNYIGQGKGDGIEFHGLGGSRIFNNILVEPGYNYLPLDTNERKYGIYVTDVSIEPDSSVQILFNDIIRPKSDGIRFQSVHSKNNLIAGNLIVDPGNFDYYENSHTSFRGEDAYVMIPNDSSDVTIQNNFFTRIFESAGISSDRYIPQENAPLIDAGPLTNLGVPFDFLMRERPLGSRSDIGAIEYLDPDALDSTHISKWVVYPNPVASWLTLDLDTTFASNLCLKVFDLSGKLVMQMDSSLQTGSQNKIRIPVYHLSSGLYLFSITNNEKSFSGKFVKYP